MIHSANRVTASVLAVLLVISLVFAPAVTARAETVDTASINLTVQADGVTYAAKLCVADTLFAMLLSMEQSDVVIALNTYLGVCDLIAECVPFLPQAYGIDIANLQKNLPNSIFAPESGSAYALPQEVYDAVMGNSGARAVSIAPSIDPAVMENFMEVILPHMESALRALTGNIQMSVSPATIGSRKVTQTTVTVTSEAVAEAASAFAESIKEDAAAKDAFAQLYDALVEAGVVTDPDLEGITGAQVMDVVWENMDELIQEVNAALIDMNMSVIANLAVDKQTQETVSVGFVINVEDSCIGVSGLLGDNYFDMQLLADGETLDILFSLDSMTDTALAASIHVSIDGEELMKMTFTMDQNSGSYLATIEADGEVLSAGGSIIQGNEGQVILTLDTLNGEPAPFQAALTLNPSDSVSIPGYQDIVTMSEEDFSALASMFTIIGQIVSDTMEAV